MLESSGMSKNTAAAAGLGGFGGGSRLPVGKGKRLPDTQHRRSGRVVFRFTHTAEAFLMCLCVHSTPPAAFNVPILL